MVSRRSLRSFLGAPRVNVVLMVLVLALLAASVLDWRVFGGDGAAAGASVDGPLVVEIRSEGLRLVGAAVSLDVLDALVRERVARHPDQLVLVELAHGVEFEEAMELLDRLGVAGVARMSLIHPDIPYP